MLRFLEARFFAGLNLSAKVDSWYKSKQKIVLREKRADDKVRRNTFFEELFFSFHLYHGKNRASRKRADDKVRL